MKSAEEYALDLFTPLRREQDQRPYEVCDRLNTRVIKQIQLDAMKEGARRAAESLDVMVGEPVTTSERARKLCYNAILATAEHWTTKDL